MNQLNPIIQSKSHTPASPSINLYFTFLSRAFVCLCSTWLAGDSKLQKKSHNFSGCARDTGKLKKTKAICDSHEKDQPKFMMLAD